MKIKYPDLFGIVAVLMLVASLVMPANLISPDAAQADPGICKWDTLKEPGNLPGTEVIARGTDIIDMAVGSASNIIIAVVNEGPDSYAPGPTNLFKWSNTSGLFWTSSKWLALAREPEWGGVFINGFPADRLTRQCYQVAIAPDDPDFFAITTDSGTPLSGPKEVWITRNGGANWSFTNLASRLNTNETIRCIDISVDYGNRRDIAVGTSTGTGAGRLFMIKSSAFSSWQDQRVSNGSAPPPIPGVLNLGSVDFFALKFSPFYPSDSCLTVVCADNVTYAACSGPSDDRGATFYNVAVRDVDKNTTLQWAFTVPGIEVASAGQGFSPGLGQLNKATLQLPSDFSGQSAALRRAYVSLDSFGSDNRTMCSRDGIFRIDDSTVSTLMSTSQIPDKAIYSIAYFGTYSTGKLMAGERMGYPCTATVPVWFTDSPANCAGSCWYPCLKCPTGATCDNVTCAVGAKDGVGAAIVGWSPRGDLAYAATGSRACTTGSNWFSPLVADPSANDESALSISRNNGETWNQISLIDTTINKFTDVAPSPDCKTVYLASVNSSNITGCCSFDSVWRTSDNPDVALPLPPQPVGTYWERVFTHVTAPSCNQTQTDFALLRVVPYCADPTGQNVAWAVYGHNQTFDHGVAAWSPDFGDYWAMLTPRNPVQDFCFESRTVMYFLSPDGKVQKMPYTGTAWSSSLPDVDSLLSGAHTIAAYPEGKVLVGANAATNASYFATSYCINFITDNPTFALQALSGNTGNGGDVHVAFDPDFKDNNTYFIGVDDQTIECTGSVFRNNPMAQLRWQDTDMMATINGAIGCPHAVGQYGIALAFTGSALYTAHTFCEPIDCSVDRTIDDGTGRYGPLSGIPKPGIAWDHLEAGFPLLAPCFTLEPSSLKICGCCTPDTDSTLYAIDNADYDMANGTGLVWAFTDCLAKRGPALITEDNALIGCDPVSGRAQEVNLCWEQLCVANAYDIEIAKNPDFTIKIIDIAVEDTCDPDDFLVPADVTTPCVFFPAGGAAVFNQASAIAAWGNLECGHTYYWRVKARSCATTQVIRSPWSETRSFTVKAGLPVVSPYLGPQLLAPNNSCLGCPVSPISFSWSPFKETTKYKFVLAKDPEFTQVVTEAEVTTTAYEYDGSLDYSTNYFWRVMAEEPAPSDWSATFSFQTEAKPIPTVESSGPPRTPIWVWVIIAVGAILLIITLVLILMTRRV
jgi:hypothetical protein